MHAGLRACCVRAGLRACGAAGEAVEMAEDALSEALWWARAMMEDKAVVAADYAAYAAWVAAEASAVAGF